MKTHKECIEGHSSTMGMEQGEWDRIFKRKRKPLPEEIESIKWQGSESDIQAVFAVLFDKGFIIQEQFDRRHFLIMQHFSNKAGKPFKNEQLKKTASASKDASKRTRLNVCGGRANR